jgi:hypothetical protein
MISRYYGVLLGASVYSAPDSETIINVASLRKATYSGDDAIALKIGTKIVESHLLSKIDAPGAGAGFT